MKANRRNGLGYSLFRYCKVLGYGGGCIETGMTGILVTTEIETGAKG